MIQYDDKFEDDSILPFLFVINSQSKPARGQVHFCHKPIINLFQKGISQDKQ